MLSWGGLPRTELKAFGLEGSFFYGDKKDTNIKN